MLVAALWMERVFLAALWGGDSIGGCSAKGDSVGGCSAKGESVGGCSVGRLRPICYRPLGKANVPRHCIKERSPGISPRTSAHGRTPIGWDF